METRFMHKIMPLLFFAVIATLTLAITTTDANAASDRSKYKNYISTAERAEQQGDWFEAVRMYRLALEIKPGKKKIMRKLDEVSEKAAAAKAQEVQEMLTRLGVQQAGDFQTLEDIQQIERIISEGLGYSASNSDLKQLAALATSGRDELGLRMDKLHETLNSHLDGEQWEDAKSILTSMRQIDSTSPVFTQADTRFQQAVQEAFDNAISHAESQGDLEQAISLSRKACALHASSYWQQTSNFFGKLDQARRDFEQQDAQHALETLKSIESQRRESAIYESLASEVKDVCCQRLLSEAEENLAHRYWHSIQCLKQAADLGNATASQKLNSERSKATQRLQTRVAQLESEQRFGQAMFEIQAYANGFGSPGVLQSAMRKCDTALRNRMPLSAQLNIQFQGVDPAYETQLKSCLNSAVRNRFTNIALGNANLMLNLTVGSVFVDERQSNRTDSVRYQSGTRQEANPKWNQWKALRDATYRETDNELARGLINASQPPRYVNVPVYDDHTYTVNIKEVDGSLSGDLEIVIETFDGQKIPVTYKSGSAQFNKSDEGHGSFPRANLSHDPLEVPSKPEVLKALANDLAKQLVPSSTEIEQQIAKTFLTRAEELVMAGEKKMATEYIMTLVANGKGSEKLINWMKENAL